MANPRGRPETKVYNIEFVDTNYFEKWRSSFGYRDIRLRYIGTDRFEKADAGKIEEEIVVTSSECVVDLAHILLSLLRPRRYHNNSGRAVSYRTTHNACQISLITVVVVDMQFITH